MPDGTGLPAGSGTPAQGARLYAEKCSSCHGDNGRNPVAAGAAPMVSGPIAGIDGPKTIGSFYGYSTIVFDFVRRAMPWNMPRTLRNDEVYAVTAYLLNLGGVLPDDAVLSNTNIAEVQQKLPNRNGLTTDHGLWPGKGIGNGGKADVRVPACMHNCADEPKLASLLPDFARNAHGNLAAQNRGVGAQYGVDTMQPAGSVVTLLSWPLGAKLYQTSWSTGRAFKRTQTVQRSRFLQSFEI